MIKIAQRLIKLSKKSPYKVWSELKNELLISPLHYKNWKQYLIYEVNCFYKLEEFMISSVFVLKVKVRKDISTNFATVQFYIRHEARRILQSVSWILYKINLVMVVRF